MTGITLSQRIAIHSGFLDQKTGAYRYYNMNAAALQQYARLEARIAELGGTVPEPWPWIDGDIVLRLEQLLETVERLQGR